MKKKKIYHINDRSMKYQSLILSRHQHQYLGLPGTFEARYPQEIVFPNMEAGRADEFYSTVEGLLIDLEEESGDITDKVLEKVGKYVIFGAFMYSKRPYAAIICHKDPKKEFEYFKLSPSLFLKVHYIYIPQDALWMKYENLIKKIEQKQQLTVEETLDIAFVAKFISKEYGQFITESLAKSFRYAKLNEEIPKRDIGVLLGAMILKHFDDNKKIDELMEVIDMKQINEEIRIITREEFADEFEKIEKEKREMKNENIEIKNENIKLKEGIKQVAEKKNLDPESKKILNSLIIP
ncbi:MAG: hypothetical protein IJ287_11390 [Methanobrevibacter sp.]|nr:hypothetical protein [Methanobrevibacter sp.]